MKKMIRILSRALLLCLCVGLLSVSVFGSYTNMDYFFNPTVATAGNELFAYNGSVVTTPLDPGTLDASRGSHYYAGNGNFSRYSSAHVCRSGSEGEEPVVYDAYGTPYYVQAPHATMEKRGLFVDDYYMDGQHIMEKCYARWDYIQTFVLADTHTGRLSTVYCADQTTPAVVHNYYNIQNLEDAAYYSPAQAQYIRSVALNGYWGQPEGLGSLSALKNMLAASGQFTEAELALVTDGVAMTATQYAIWHYTNSSTGDKRISVYNTTDSGGITRVSEEQKASVDVLFKLFHFLVNLTPAPVESNTANSVINQSNFLTGLSVNNAVLIEDHVNNQDGDENNDAYTADVTFTMGVRPLVDNGDDLVVQIVDMADNVLVTGRISGALQEGEIPLDGSGGTYTFHGMELIEGNQLLKVKLNGHQQLRQGVYLYTHENGYSASQTLVGIAQGTHAVDLERSWELNFSVENERSVRILKESSAGVPLPGITFDFYRLAGRDEYLSGEAALPENPADYTALPAAPDFTVTTGEDGIAAYDLTANGKADGVYLAVERAHPAVVGPVDPIYVLIPGSAGDNTRPIYRVETRLVNEIRSDTDIVKDVIVLDNNLSNQNAYDPHTWIISTTIPADIGIGRSFTVSDLLDPRLDYLGNVRVTAENMDGTTVALTLAEGTDYSLSVTDNDSLAAEKPSDAFSVSLTRAGMEKVAGAAASADITRLRVYFDARINANARMGERIPNRARLEYVNSLGISFNPASDIPEVYTGGARLKKVDANNTAAVLQGAEFKLYRRAGAEEAADETVAKVTLEGVNAPLVPVRFFNNPDLSGEKTDTAVSGEDGFVYIYGLVDGEYYLAETKAPEGYVLPDAPIKLTVSPTSHMDENIIVAKNTGHKPPPSPSPSPSPSPGPSPSPSPSPSPKPTPTPTPTPSPTPYIPPYIPPPSPPKLPQTGQLNWPVPLLTAAGLIFLGCALYLRRKSEADDT